MTKRNVIAVYGSTDAGRAGAVFGIYTWLVSDFMVSELVPYRFRGKGMSCVIKFNDFKIGLCSTADIRESIAGPLGKIAHYDCEILICTCRARTCSDVNTLVDKGYTIRHIRFGNSPDVNFMRLKDALIENISSRI